MKLYQLIPVPKLLLLSAVLLLSSCAKETARQEDDKPVPCLTDKEKKSLNPLTVQSEKVIKKLRLNGHIAYDPQAVVDFVSLVGGTVTRTYFSLGDKVRKGQVMAEIKSAELNSLEAKEKQLKAQLKVAKRELEATRGFYEDRVSSERELIAAQSKKEDLEAELEGLQQNLKLYSSKSNQNTFQIKASQSGVIVKNRLVPGLRFAAESAPLFMISDLEQVWVKLNIYATEIGVVKEGMTIHVKSSSYPDRVFPAKIKHVSAVIDDEENVLKAWAVLDNPDRALKPGLHVETIVDVEDDKTALRLPINALVFKDDKYYAVILNDCKTQRREVEVLYQDEVYAYIDKGLEKGEKVVTKDALRQLEHSGSRED